MTKGEEKKKTFRVIILIVLIVSQVHTYVKTYQLGALNMDSILNVKYTSIKLFL